MASFAASQQAPLAAAAAVSKPRKKVRWEDRDHPISDVMSIVDDVRHDIALRQHQNNHRTGSIIAPPAPLPLPASVLPPSGNKHLTFSTGLRPNTAGTREGVTRGPIRVHKPIKTKKLDALRRRTRHHHHQHHSHGSFTHTLPSVLEEGPRDKLAIEVDENDGDDEHEVANNTSGSSRSSLDEIDQLRPLLPSRDVGSDRFYKDLLDNLVNKRALYETEISHGCIDGAERRLIRKRLRDVKNDMVVLMRRRGDFQVVVAMSGLDEESKRECLGQLAKSILRSEEIANAR